MKKKLYILVAFSVLGCLMVSFGFGFVEVAGAKEKANYNFVFVPGCVHPFYNAIQRGVEYAAKTLGVKAITQIPQSWDAAVQTQILDSILAGRKPDLLIVCPVDRVALIEPLKRFHDAGIPVLTADLSIADGIYEPGHEVTFPISYIGSDNLEGGRICGDTLAKAIGSKGKVYIQNFKAGAQNAILREKGFRQSIANYPDIEIIGVDYNDFDDSKSTTQTAAVLQRVPDLAGIFATNDTGSLGAGLAVQNAGKSGKVKVLGFDFSPIVAEHIKRGAVDMALSQKPYDMGILSVLFGYAYLKGATDLPKKVPTGFYIATTENINDPYTAKWINK